MAYKPTKSEIGKHFLDTFPPKRKLTPSEWALMYKKLSNLKKVVAEYLETTNFQTDKSVEKIIYDAITYAGMSGYKLNSIASIGYDILPKSLVYWAKVEQAQKDKAKLEAEAKAEEEAKELLAKKIQENTERMAETRIVPKWMHLDEDE